MQFAPGAFPFDSDFIARLTSCSEGESARLLFVGHCGISDKTDVSKVVSFVEDRVEVFNPAIHDI